MGDTIEDGTQRRGRKRGRTSRSPSPAQACGEVWQEPTERPQRKKHKLDVTCRDGDESFHKNADNNRVLQDFPTARNTQSHHPLPASPISTAKTMMGVKYKLEEGDLGPELAKKPEPAKKRKLRHTDAVVAHRDALSILKSFASVVPRTRSLEGLSQAKPAVTQDVRKARAKEHRTAAAELGDEMMAPEWKMNEFGPGLLFMRLRLRAMRGCEVGRY